MNEIKPSVLMKLTPTTEARLGVYEEQLTSALTDPDIRNIALSGPYGAGKSSILATYKKSHSDKKFLHISFAHFQDKAKEGETPDETRLEGKIINQLIHQMPAEAIPQTHFQILKEVDRDKIKKYLYWGVLLAALLAFICFHDAWCRLVDSLSLESLRSLLGITRRKEAVLAAAAAWVVLAVSGLTEYIFLQRNQRILRKVNLKGANLDIELFGGESDSYFDRYLNEVLYLFDHVDADAVVFEDIDRYDRNLIFERLREINGLANRIREGVFEEKREERKPLRFLYLIRDDVFASKDRTKFFDMIIPVVPVMDGSNSYAMLIRLFSQLEEEARPGDDFLRGISLYIDDMRLLGNIFNEYSVYYRNYQANNAIELNTDKLLAMMVYKNLFPQDHALLHRGTGYVYTLFANKPQFVRQRREELQKELDSLERLLEEVKRETFRNMDELDAAYYVENRRTRIGGTTEDTKFSNRVEYIAAIRENEYNIEYYAEGYYASNRWIKENVKAKFDQLSKIPDYQRHRELIEKKAVAEEARQRVSEVKNQIEHLDTMPLQGTIDREKEDEIFGAVYTNALGEKEYYADVKRSDYFPLIRYLVSNGYIDESYQDYMSYYYEDGLRREDKVFLRSIQEHKYKGAAFQLKEPWKVISWMHNSQFETAECLNYQLLDVLLMAVCHPMYVPMGMKKRDVDYEDRLNRLLQYIIKNKSMEFFEGYLWNGAYGSDFIWHINVVCGHVISWVISEEALSHCIKRIYALLTMLQEEVYRSEDPGDLRPLAAYVGANPLFLYEALSESEGEKFISGMEHMGVKFNRLLLTDEETLEAEASNGTNTVENHFQILQQVYYRKLYVPNELNIKAILMIFYELPPEEIRHSQLLTLVYKKEEQPLRYYVEENLETVLKELAAGNEPLEDEEKVILSVLNREDLSQESREKYIGALACRGELSHLNQVKNQDFWPRLMEGHVAAAPSNLTDYYFLTENGMDEALAGYINKYPGPITLSEKELDKAYGEGKAKLLLMDIMRCNSLVKEKYNELVKSFPLTCDAADAGDVDEDKMRILIFWKKVPMNQENLRYIREHYPRLASVFASRNIAEYLSLFRAEGETSKEEYLSVIVSDRELFSDFMHSEEEPPERKKKALAESVNRSMLRLSELERYLKFPELRDFIGLLNGKCLTLEQTPGNKALLDAFLAKNWIVKYDADEQDDALYRAQGKAVLGKKSKKK